MKNIFKLGIWVLVMMTGLSSCDDFFDTIPGVQYDLEGTFSNRQKTEQFLNNVYSYVPDETMERNPLGRGGIWTGGSIEGDITWDNIANHWGAGTVYANGSWINYWFIEYYKAIAKASTFIANVDKCADASTNDRLLWKAQARALRAYYYFLLFRSYGPVVLLGEESIPLDAPLDELLKERSSVDECVDFIVEEFDKAAADLPAKYSAGNLGRMDKGSCKAFKAKLLLYAASPLFNCNSDYVNIVNTDGKQLFPQDASKEAEKWERARAAYEEFFRDFVPTYYSLHYVTTTDGKKDFYESYRQATSGTNYTNNQEQIFIRLVDHNLHAYETTPYHKGANDQNIRGGLGFGTTQEMVDLFFTDKGIRIVDDPDYQKYEYTGVPSKECYGALEDFNDPVVPERNYFKANDNLTLKQWANREPRFYANVTFNGSTWLNTTTNDGEFTTELYLNGNSGLNAAGHDAPYEGYGIRKTASKGGWLQESKHCSTLLRLADMYLGYAAALSACGKYDEAMKNVNEVRARAGIPGYGNKGGKDVNGKDYITYPENRADVDKRIRRERLIELAYEWNHFFDVRRWKVADMAVGDDWIYPSYHKGGEGGAIYGMNFKADPPQFFEKIVTDTRVFDKRHYFFPIPDADIRRNPKMVQNYGWATAEPIE